MKKHLVLLVAALAALLTACSRGGQTSQVSEMPADAFANSDITDFQKSIYESRGFDANFTPEEYIKLCSVLDEMSAEPYYAINSNLIAVKQDLSTYNAKQEKYRLIDATGNVIIDYADNGWIVDTFTNIRFGDYIFIKTNGNPRKYDIINDNGDLINRISFNDNDTPELIWNFENGYYLFATVRKVTSNSYDLYILKPDGQYCSAVSHPPRYFNPNINLDVDNSTYSLDATFGKISEGLYSVCYDYLNNGKETCAFYCNVDGELVINLSSDEMNFHVTKLGDFDGEEATIEFIGADGKNYLATINISGEFIEDPKLAS